MSVPMNGAGGIDVQPFPLAAPSSIEGAQVAPQADGSIQVALGEAAPAVPFDTSVHDGNLASALESGEEVALVQQVLEWVRADKSSREEWEHRLRESAQQLGIAPTTLENGVIKGASQVVHPLVAEAAVQFQARAIEELFPAGGPVKGVVLGDSTPDLASQADRVEQYLNYHLTVRDEDYFDNFDKTLFVVALTGSEFRKSFIDPVKNIPVTRMVSSLRFFVPYTAANLFESPRYTEEMPMHINDVKRAMANGFYKDVDLGTAVQPVMQGAESLENDADNRSATMATGDDVRTLYECHCDWEFKWDDGAKYALPYVITVDKDSMKVLGIRRNWKEADTLKLKRMWYTHYKYLPGLGFYGFGLLHIIGQLGAAATGLLRSIIDSAARANFSGGFRSKEARKAGAFSPGMGEWLDIDLTAEELKNAFFPLPYKEPGPGVFNALQTTVEGGQRFASTTEAMVGDAGASGPMGTMLALIEQGSKVYTGIHKRLHNAFGRELRLMSDLIGERMPDTYEYHVKGASQNVRKSDFSDRVDVTPISDPAVVSSTQRMAQAQMAKDMVKEAPGLYDRDALRKAHAALLKAAKIPYADELLGPEPGPKRHDPATENAMMLTGLGVRAFMDEDHQAHMLVHQNFMMTSVPPEMQQQLAPVMAAHLAEHVALMYRRNIMMATQMPLPLEKPGDDPPELPPQLEMMVAVKTAQFIAQAQVAQAAAAPPKGPAGG